MGVVYRAVDERSGQPVALKTVRLVEASRLSQIRREVQSLARLTHPGIVRILDHGVDTGMPWYAMELLEGRTLGSIVTSSLSARADDSLTGSGTAATWSSVVDATRETMLASESALPTAPAAEPTRAPAVFREAAGGQLPQSMGLLIRLCETLAYAHGEGIVHCDVKPSNVFVLSSGKPVLVDFGLAYCVGDSAGRDQLQAEILTGGSARYMAPEQIRGEALDPRCDLYSLGCVMFELITGRGPFEGSVADVVDQHLRRPPPLLRSIVPDVPEDLERLVSRLLIKQRRQRIGYARDVVTVLARFEAHAPAWDTPPPRAHTYLYRPPLVGRQEVLARIARLSTQTLEKHGSFMLISGESGVGKTRLAFEVARYAAHAGLLVVAGGGRAFGMQTGRSGPLEPLKPFLHVAADRCTEYGEAETRRILGEDGALLRQYEPSLGLRSSNAQSVPPPPLPANAARAVLYRALSNVLTAFSETTPLLLILDDLQWADELTLGFLKHLASGALRTKAAFVLGLARSEELSPELKRLAAEPEVQACELQRLSPEEVGRMVAGMLSIDEAAPEFVRYLSEKSEGNSFFVAEYLRMAVAEQVLVRDSLGHWRLAESTEPTSVMCESLPLPQSLREVVERRLEGLTKGTRDIMLLAATLGREFELSTLQLVTSSSDSEILDAMSDLVQRHVVEPVEDGAGFRFTHDKLRELPYAGLGDAGRKHNHRCVAMALEQRRVQGHMVEPGVLGQHWLEAGEPLRAFPHLCTAGDQAMQLNALDRAALQFGAAEQALMALPAPDPSELSSIREKLADALTLLGRLDDAQTTLERALASLPDDAHLVRARQLRKLGKVLEILHRHDAALEVFARAEAEYVGIDLRSSQLILSDWIRLQLSRIWIYYWLARVSDMNATIETVRPYIDESALPIDRSDYYQALVRRDYREHRYVISDETLQYAHESLRAAQEAKAQLEAAFAQFNYGFCLLFHGQLSAAEEQLREARAATRRLGDSTSEIRCLAYLALTYRRAQRFEDARMLAEETLARASAAQMVDYVGLAQACLGWLARRRGHHDEALHLSQQALASWESLSFPYPFQWAGALTCLAVQLTRVPLRSSIQLASKLLAPQLARLPEPVDRAIDDAVNAYHAGHQEAALEHLQQAITVAEQLGYV